MSRTLMVALLGVMPLIATAQRVRVERILAPAGPGGGWDQVARAMQRALESTDAGGRVQVDNVPGAAGTVGLARFVSTERGDPRALLVTGLVMVGGIVQNRSPATLDETTPIARLVGEAEVLVVPAASPIITLGDLLSRLRSDPNAVSWGGGSAGGTDQMLVDLLARSVGVDPRQTNYVAFAGGGEAKASVLAGLVTVGVSGLGEFIDLIRSNRVRPLALSGPSSDTGVSIPTLRDLGVDVELSNWRGVVAAPGITARERGALIALLDSMVRSPAWTDELRRRGWENQWLPGDAFSSFLAAETHRVELLAAARRGVSSPAAWSSVARYPVVVAAILLACLVRLFSRARTPLLMPTGKTSSLVILVAGFLANLALVNVIGFVLAGTILFVSAAAAFDERRWARSLVLGCAFAALVFVVFRHGLGVALPSGSWWGALR